MVLPQYSQRFLRASADIFAFLTKFDHFATFFAWDAPKCLQALPLFLEGCVLCIYDTLPDTTRQKFGRLQTALQEHFSPIGLHILEKTALLRERAKTPFYRLQQELNSQEENAALPEVLPTPSVPTILEIMDRQETPTPPIRTLPLTEEDLKQIIERMLWEREGNIREREGNVRKGGTNGIRKPDNFLGTAKSNPSNFIAQHNMSAMENCWGGITGNCVVRLHFF